MPNQLILSKEDPEIAAALEGCKVGEPITLNITVTPTKDTDTEFVADVDEVQYSNEKPQAPAPDESEPEGDESMPPAVRAMGRAKAVTA